MQLCLINDWTYFVERSIWQIPEALCDNLWIFSCWLLTVFVYWLVKHRQIEYFQPLFLILVVESLLFILYHSLFNRLLQDCSECNLIPFWSDRTNDYRGLNLIIQNVLNIVLYVPYGFFLSGAVKNHSWKRVIGVGLATSIFVEFAQFLFRCGFCETDDLIHNGFGTFIGLIMYVLAKKIYKKFN